MPRGNLFAYVARKMKKRATKGGVNKPEKKVKVRRVKQTQRTRTYG